MKQFDCLSPDQKIDGKIFIEASAGTGKTFAIEHIVRRLILKGVPLKRILITTFTKKGVRDLKRRIYENLRNALQDPSYSRDERLTLENTLALIEEAEIHTIHSFCHRSLSEFAFEAGITMNQDDPESEEKQREVKSAIFDTLRTTLDDQEFSPAQLLRLMSYFLRDVQKLSKKMISFLEQESEIEEYLPYTKLKERFDQLIASCDINLLKEDLYHLALIHKKCADRSGARFAYVDKQIESIDNLEQLIQTTPSIFSLFIDTNLKKGKQRSDCKLHCNDIVEEIKSLVIEASDPLITFMRLCQKARSRVDQIAMKNPSYLLDAMVSKLENKQFYQLIRRRYEAVIIDEFQDTDPKQWTIFSRLFDQSANPFIVVGDPKQSIYGFRGADLATYLKAKETFTEKYILTTNYRSHHTLIDTLNRLFNNRAIKETFSLPYESITSGVKDDDSSSVTLFMTNDGEEKIMQFVAGEICRLKQEEGYPLAHTAILVKDRFQAERMAKVLEEKSIPLISSTSESIIDSAAFNFIEVALKLRSNVRNLSYFNQFLLHPFVGFPIEAISTDLLSPHVEELITKFSMVDAKCSRRDDAAFLRALCNETFYEKPIIDTIQEDAQNLSDLMQSIEVIFSLNRTHPLDAIEEIRKKRDLVPAALNRRPLSDHDAVTIMTMHMSKGLEFEIVFPIGIIAPYKTKQEFTKTSKQKLIRFDQKGAESKRELHALDQEKMRLFYVALTRAKSRLYLPICAHPAKPKPGSASSMDLFLSALLSNKTLSQQELYENISLINDESVTKVCGDLELDFVSIDNMLLSMTNQTEEEEATTAQKCNVTLNQDVQKTTSFSAIAAHPPPRVGLEIDPNEMPPGAHTGNLFHLLFEKIIETGLYYPWKDEEIKQLIQNDLVHTHLSDWVEKTYKIIYKAFHTQLDGFTLSEVSPNKMLQEAPFLFTVTDSLDLKGFADLVFVHNETFYILDWKMNYLNDYTAESLEEAMNAHDYKLQASIYAEALKRYTLNFDRPLPIGGSFYFFLRGMENGVYFHQAKELELEKIGEGR